MRAKIALFVLGVAVIALALAVAGEHEAKPEAPADWAIKATIIEACSCPMFCQCYFNTSPAGHHGEHGEVEHYCRFNNAYEVASGHYGETDLGGARFWVGGDTGGDFDDKRMDWARLHFDPAVTPAQRDGIAAIMRHVYPVEWDSFEVGEDGTVDWSVGGGSAVATLAGGEMAEVRLEAMPSHSGEPVVIQNLTYWGLPRHAGFVLMPNEVEAYRVGDDAFEYRDSNGFMLTFEITSADFAV